MIKEIYHRNWFFFHPIRRWEYMHIASQLKPEDELWDAGCGNGALTYHFAKRVKSVLATDSSDLYLSVARTDNTAHNINYQVQDLQSSLLGNRQFSIITCVSVFGQLNQRQETLNRLISHLKPEALFTLLLFLSLLMTLQFRMIVRKNITIVLNPTTRNGFSISF